jgi:hypothetical protein
MKKKQVRLKALRASDEETQARLNALLKSAEEENQARLKARPASDESMEALVTLT